MAYDRYDRDNRNRPAGRDRFYDSDRDDGRFFGSDRNYRDERHDERGWFERAGDEVASWFGDDDAERRRRRDHGSERSGRDSYDRDYRPTVSRHNDRMSPSPRGDYDRNEGLFAATGSSRTYGDREDQRFVTSSRSRARDNGQFGSMGARLHDPHYNNWRQRQIDDLDRDYDEYRRENQARFESDFGNWRDRRMTKRSLLTGVREQMEVVGSDEQHVGTIDRIAGDRIILTKNDEKAGGVHHSLSCSDIDRVEDNRVILEVDSAEAQNRWRDENRSRALFEREDQGEAGPRILDRSFEGTYR